MIRHQNVLNFLFYLKIMANIILFTNFHQSTSKKWAIKFWAKKLKIFDIIQVIVIFAGIISQNYFSICTVYDPIKIFQKSPKFQKLLKILWFISQKSIHRERLNL